MHQYNTRISAICKRLWGFTLQRLDGELAGSQGTPDCPSWRSSQVQPSTGLVAPSAWHVTYVGFLAHLSPDQ